MAKTKKTEQRSDKIEREYVIPLRPEWKKVPRYKKANKAVKAIKEFLVRHMKIRDRDLNKIKLDKLLNEIVWARGIKKPPAKIKVKAVKENGIVRVELVELPDKQKFKKTRFEKRDKKAVEIAEKKKTTMQKARETMQGDKQTQKSVEPQTSEQKAEDEKEKEEKKTAVIESTQKMEKEAAKQTKHSTKTKGSEQKHQQRKALAK